MAKTDGRTAQYAAAVQASKRRAGEFRPAGTWLAIQASTIASTSGACRVRAQSARRALSAMGRSRIGDRAIAARKALRCTMAGSNDMKGPENPAAGNGACGAML
jgi:hypothetical protein